MGKQEYTVDEFREKILFDIEIETSDSVILMCAIIPARPPANAMMTSHIVGDVRATISLLA